MIINSVSIALTKTCKVYCNSFIQLSLFFAIKVYRAACVLSQAIIWYTIVDTQKHLCYKQDLKYTKISIVGFLSFTQLDKEVVIFYWVSSRIVEKH